MYICACVISSSFFVCETCSVWTVMRHVGVDVVNSHGSLLHYAFMFPLKTKLASFTVLVLKMNGN